MESSKKPKFDKKKWRENKYDKKFQVKKWEEKKKKILLNKLHKQLKKENGGNIPSKPALQQNTDNYKQKPERLSRIQLAQLEFKKVKEQKQKVIQDRLKKKEEIAEAMVAYKKKKFENYKLLSKKTKKGQPVMKGRMQLLFEQVKKTVDNSQ